MDTTPPHGCTIPGSAATIAFEYGVNSGASKF